MALAYPGLHRIAALPVLLRSAKAGSPVVWIGQVLFVASAAAVVSAALGMAAIAVAPPASSYAPPVDLSAMMTFVD